ncbi:MAG TPA: CrcB family protein [Flavobacteriales bacterium]|nr:CrcB family protein [Flavobacteriales bacterium]
MEKVLLVFAGGGLGSVGRYGLAELVKRMGITSTFPWATLCANVLACLIFATVVYFFKGRIGPHSALLLTTGFCGGLSTFSTFSYETIELFNRQLYMTAMVYIGLSIILCFGCILLIYKA